ncbi:MAG: hypothetical protein ACYSU0_07955, partial [Planctomycetota bacterium]
MRITCPGCGEPFETDARPGEAACPHCGSRPAQSSGENVRAEAPAPTQAPPLEGPGSPARSVPSGDAPGPVDPPFPDSARRHTADEPVEVRRRSPDGEVIAERPAPLIHHARKKLARHRAVAAISTFALAAIVGLTAWYVGSLRASLRETERERDRAIEAEKKEAERRRVAEAREKEAEVARAAEAKQREVAQADLERAERENYLNKIELAQRARGEPKIARIVEILDGCPARFRNWEWGRLKHLTHPELLTFKGHAAGVSSVAFSPDGKRIVTGSWRKTAKLWDAATGAEVMTLKGHAGPVYSVAFSPDGRWIVTASTDRTAKLWDAATGAEGITLKGHASAVFSAAFSSDGKRIVTGSADKTAKVWDAATGAEVMTLKGHASAVFAAAFSPDGRRIVTGSADKT